MTAAGCISLGAAGGPGNVLRISDSTIAINQAFRGAGVVLRDNPNNATALDRVTIARNAGATNEFGNGVSVNDSEVVRIGGSIIAANTGDGVPTNCDAKLATTGGNVEDGANCGFGSSDLSSTNPGLSTALTAAGGETPVLTIPTIRSPALDFGGACTGADQRDLVSPAGPGLRLGRLRGRPAARRIDHRRPDGADQRQHADVHLHRQRAGRQVTSASVDSGAFTACSLPVHDPGAAPTAATPSTSVRSMPPGRPGRPPVARSPSTPTAPDTTITSGPNGPPASTTATFTFTSNDQGATFQCQLDGGLVRRLPGRATPGSPRARTPSQVRAIDAAGNLDASPATRTLTVDTVAPDTDDHRRPERQPSRAPARRSRSPRPRPARPSSARSTAPRSRRARPSYTGRSQGSHTLRRSAPSTPAGNADATPRSRTWTVDTVAPDTTITAGPSGPTASTSADVHVQLERDRLDLRVLARRRPASPPARPATPASPGHAHLRGPCHRRRRQRRRHARDARSWTVDTVAPDTTHHRRPERHGRQR